MILVTHAIIGSAIGHRASSVLVAFVMGFASHYIFDMIPHWHYPVPKIEAAVFMPFGKKSITLDRRYWPEFGRILADLTLGILISLFLFNGSLMIVLAAAVGAVLPDLLVGFSKFNPVPALVWHDRFHRWIHTTTRLDDYHVFGILSQASIIVISIWIFS